MLKNVHFFFILLLNVKKLYNPEIKSGLNTQDDVVGVVVVVVIFCFKS